MKLTHVEQLPFESDDCLIHGRNSYPTFKVRGEHDGGEFSGVVALDLDSNNAEFDSFDPEELTQNADFTLELFEAIYDSVAYKTACSHLYR